MFIEQALKPENQFWKYIVGALIIIVASFIGQIPFAFALFFHAASEGLPVPTDSNEVLNFLSPNMTLLLMLVSFLPALVAVFIVVKTLHAQTIRALTTARPKIDWKRVFFAFGLWGGITVLSVAIDYALFPEDYVWNFDPIRFTVLAVIAISLVPIQTSAEEYIFRGYLMQGFGILAKNRLVPLIVTSLLFGLMHIANPEVGKLGYSVMVFYIGTGLMLGIVTLMDDGIELALGFHAANNLIGALLVTSDWSAFRTDSVLKDISEPGTGPDVLLPVLVIFPILLFIFSKKYKWSDWKERLTGKIDEHGSIIPQEDAGQPNI